MSPSFHAVLGVAGGISTFSLTKPACCGGQCQFRCSHVSGDSIGTYLAAALVGQVQGIPRKLHTTIAVALGEETVVVSWYRARSLSIPCPKSHSRLLSILTDNLPDQVWGDIGERSGGHCARIRGIRDVVPGSCKSQQDQRGLKLSVGDDPEVWARLAIAIRFSVSKGHFGR